MIGAAGFLTDKARELADLPPQETAVEPVTYQDDETAVQKSGPDYKRLSVEDHLEIARLNARGLTQRKIANIIGCSQPSVSEALRRMTDKADVVQALLRAQSVTAAEQWGKAITKAAEQGNHRPARELIEAAHPELRPQQGSSAGGVGVVINIGQPGAPVLLPDITVSTVAAPLSPVTHQQLTDKSTG